jgi:glycosyltransferase involved in cell wall biosynthesis
MHVLVCNAQVPFAHGGAENLAEGLIAALNARGHRAELVALPLKWYPKIEIFKSALAWRLLDLTEANGIRVDRLIATKFPSYAARHPHKIVWLVHQLRQAYDWYGTPLSDLSDPRAREKIFALDRRTLNEARARYAISCNVAARLRKFNALDADCLYPPPRLEGRFRADEYGNYVLFVGRLDAAKRVDLLIRAVRENKTARVIIAGAGPDARGLQNLAHALGVADRVEFAGFVDDARLIELYANARAVYYAPLDEDYGFATVEAFFSARPVITTADAGGVLEFVEHEATGLVVPPDPSEIARALARVLDDERACRAWGNAGREKVKDIRWDVVVEKLTS